MCICSDAHFTGKYYVSYDVFNAPFGISPIYIYIYIYIYMVVNL